MKPIDKVPRWVDHAILVLAIVAILSLAACAAGPPAPVGSPTPERATSCVATADRLAAYQRVAAGQIAFTAFDGRKAAAAIALLNSIPPETSTTLVRSWSGGSEPPGARR